LLTYFVPLFKKCKNINFLKNSFVRLSVAGVAMHGVHVTHDHGFRRFSPIFEKKIKSAFVLETNVMIVFCLSSGVKNGHFWRKKN
jgi:hypothetical protein